MIGGRLTVDQRLKGTRWTDSGDRGECARRTFKDAPPWGTVGSAGGVLGAH